MKQLNRKKLLAFSLICCMFLVEFFNAATQISLESFAKDRCIATDCHPAFTSHIDISGEDASIEGILGGFIQTLAKRVRRAGESNDEERVSEEFYPILVFTGMLYMFQILFRDRHTAPEKGQRLALILRYIHNMDGKKDMAAAVGV